MSVIVAGALTIKRGHRDSFVEQSKAAVRLARQHAGCESFSVSADSVDPDRVNIFERWTSRAALEAFRNSGPDDDSFDLVEAFDVDEYDV